MYYIFSGRNEYVTRDIIKKKFHLVQNLKTPFFLASCRRFYNENLFACNQRSKRHLWVTLFESKP